MKRHSAESALEKFAAAWKVWLSHNTVEVYADDLESSDTSRTQVEEGSAVRAGAPDLTVPMPVLAYKKASIENDDVCIGLWCLYWSVFELV